MKEIREEVIDTSSMLLGNNEFETAVCTVEANSEIKAGSFLQRENGKFILSAPEGTVISALATCDLKNDGSGSKDFPCRVLISGKVRDDKLNVYGSPATVEHLDLLRAVGIIPVKVNDLSQV